jgi:hypothetical protein
MPDRRGLNFQIHFPTLLNVTRILLFTLLLASFCTHAEDFDTIIRGGRVIDGTGNPAFFADIAIKNGRIAKIGKIDAGVEHQLKADGLIVAPGFIDVHTHAEDILELPLAENFVRMGVTTLVLGNCGATVAAPNSTSRNSGRESKPRTFPSMLPRSLATAPSAAKSWVVPSCARPPPMNWIK